jgi:hypothetical protein
VRRGILITILAVVAFVVIVIARLPASWVIPAPPAPFSCGAVDGSIWNGSCSGLVAQGAPVGDLTWDVHAWRLLTGKLAVNVTLNRSVGSISGDFAVGFDKSITADNAQANLPLDHDLLSLLPRGLRTLQGSLQANIAHARLTKNNIVTELKGTLQVQGLEDHDRGDVTSFGSYELTFPGNSTPPAGDLKDLGGPLGVEGHVVMMQDKPGVNLDLFITPRGNVPPSLMNQLQFLAPDAQGRRELQTEFGF